MFHKLSQISPRWLKKRHNSWCPGLKWEPNCCCEFQLMNEALEECDITIQIDEHALDMLILNVQERFKNDASIHLLQSHRREIAKEIAEKLPELIKEAL